MKVDKPLKDMVDGEWEDGSELLRFLKESNPSLRTHENDDVESITMYEGDDVIDAIADGHWIQVYDPVDTEKVR